MARHAPESGRKVQKIYVITPWSHVWRPFPIKQSRHAGYALFYLSRKRKTPQPEHPVPGVFVVPMLLYAPQRRKRNYKEIQMKNILQHHAACRLMRGDC